MDFSDYPPITEGQVFGAGLIFIFFGASFLTSRWREQRSRFTAAPDQVDTVPLKSWGRVLLTRALPIFLVGIGLVIVSFVM